MLFIIALLKMPTTTTHWALPGCAKLIVVGTETELLTTPKEVQSLDINAGERYQVRIL